MVNTRMKTAWIELISRKSQGEYFYIWEGPDFYNLELFCPVRKVPPEQSQTLSLQILYMHGLTGVSDVGGLNAFHLILPDIADQKKGFLPRLEAATASNRLVPMTVSAELYRNGKKVMDFRKVSGTAAFDLPMVFNLKPVGNVNGFADGAYTLKVDLVSEKGNLSCRKKIVFSGRKLERISLDSEVLKKQFGQLEKKLSRDRKFAIRVKLAELKSAIAGSRLENAEKIISELKTEMK